MAGLIQNYDWSATILGTPDHWPISLKTLVQMSLNSPSLMAVLWGPELILIYNDAFSKIIAGERQYSGLLGQPAQQIWAEPWPSIAPILNSVLEGNGAVSMDGVALALHSGTENISYELSPVTNDDGMINGILIVAHRTTDAIEAGKLHLSEQRFQNLVAQASAGIIMLSGPQMRVDIVNQAYATLIGRSTSQLLGKDLFDVIPEAREPFRTIIEKVRVTKEALYLYAQPYFVFADGEKKEGYLDLVYQPYTEVDGTVTGVIILCQDVTGQVQARLLLEESQARLQSVVESAPFPIGVYVGPEMHISLVNQSIIDVWGKGSDIIGRRYADVLPELAGKGIYEQLESVYNTGQPYYANNQQVDLRINGQLQRFYFKYTFTPLFDAQGKVFGVMNTAADVTDLVVAKQELEVAETSLRGAIELAQLGSWELDLDSGEISYSEDIKSWFGFDNDQVVLDQVYNPIHIEDRPIVEAAIRHALAQGSTGIYNAEYRISTSHGSERVLHALGKVIYDHDGQPRKLLGTAQDVTADRHRQQELEQLVQMRTAELASMNEELEAQNEEYLAVNEELEEANQLLVRSNDNLQQFAYVASHDLQEPLRKIQQFSDRFRSQNKSSNITGVHYLDRIQAAAGRMSVLIEDLLDFSKIETGRDIHQYVMLNNIVDTVLSDLDLVIEETGAQVQIGMLPTIQGNALQLGQLFQNLISNALKFRKPGLAPLIQITGTEILQGQLPVFVKPVRNVRVYHQIEVKDNGIGFDEKYLDRIFQVFQRLHGRHEFQGTGIGLAICEKVMVNHGGAITATSQPGQGASFRVFFPA